MQSRNHVYSYSQYIHIVIILNRQDIMGNSLMIIQQGLMRGGLKEGGLKEGA